MVSRRKILSRSRDDLNLDQTFTQQEEEEDVWYQKDKLYKEHIQEVLDKWTQIDDEIWAKVIVFERNRRVAKAYARAPVLTINGSDDGFDGMRIGLCGFDNPMRDQKTDELKRVIGQGVKIKMDDAGNILIRRYAKSNVYVKSTASSPNEETSIGAEILKLPNQALESEKIVKLFDMKKFQSNVNRELRRAYPDRRRLETQCLSSVAFVKLENDVLECPIWVLIVNVVAMDMLKSKLPPVQRPIVDIKNRPRIPIPDEDPYSVAGNGSGGSSGSSGFGSGHQSQLHPQQQQQLGKLLNNGSSGGHVAATREQLLLQTQQLAHKRSEKPPKLPPRDNVYSHDLIPKPDYDDIDLETRIKLSRGKSDKGKDNKKYDDPYYCGLRARVPNFVKSGKSNNNKDQRDGNGNSISNGGMSTLSQKKTSMIHNHLAGMHPHSHHIQQQQQQLMAAAAAAHAAHHHSGHQQQHHQIWQTRSYESGIGIYKQGGLKTHALQMQMQLQHHQQQPQSLPTDLTATATTENATATATASNQTQSTANKSRSHMQQQQTQQQHLHPHPHPHSYSHAHPHHRHHQHQHHHHQHQRSHQCERHSRLQQQQLQHQQQQQQHQQSQPFYDNLEDSVCRQVTRRLSTRRPLASEGTSTSSCNCVSCYALAPLCGAVPPPRPQRSLSQQQLRRHQRLSGVAQPELPIGGGLVKWCSESDVSVLEMEPSQNERYDDCYAYDDFDLDFDLDSDLALTRQPIPRRRRATETVDLYADRSHLRQQQAPAVLRHKSQSTESFFEQPNEEGSLYMYGGRKRIAVKAPSAANIYDRVRGSTDSDRDRERERERERVRERGGHYGILSPNRSRKTPPQLPAPSWRGGKRQEQAQNADKRRYDNATGNSNITNSNSNNNNNNIQHKRQLTNAKQDNDDMLKNKNYFNSKNKSIATTAASKASTAAKATATASETAAPASGGGGGKATGAGGGGGGAAAAAAGGGVGPTMSNSPGQTNNAPPPPPPSGARTGRSTSRLDISDMESIYGYLKPRKPRSLSLKKIQILDY
ncbi:hypothetical protein KR026_002553 [Drosophila bipectinata]|nr:hypothetical protein KR026_002553 [Drosophila bipectinata]